MDLKIGQQRDEREDEEEKDLAEPSKERQQLFPEHPSTLSVGSARFKGILPVRRQMAGEERPPYN